MINKWILNNFKSIESSENLEFRPLTIFTGANSSGKSTILQSILLVTQTLQNRASSKSIVLNGWFKKFGTYTDIVSGRDISKNIKIGFEISEDNSAPLVRRMRIIPETPNSKLKTSCEFVLSSVGKPDNLQPELNEASYEFWVDGGRHFKTNIYKNESEIDAKVEEQYRELQDYVSSQELQYSISSDLPYFPNDSKSSETDFKPIGVRFNHFLPDTIVGYSTLVDRSKAFLREYLRYGSTSCYNDKEFLKLIVPLISEKSKEIVEDLYSRNLFRVKDAEKKYNDIQRRFTLKRLSCFLRGCSIDEDERTKYVNQIAERLNKIPEQYVFDHIPMWQPIFPFIRSFFSYRINYLGPLREEPKSLYPLCNDGSISEVGLKGENTAAVFYNNKDVEIDYVSPTSFDNLKNVNLKTCKGTLAQAVKEWLVYMQVAQNVVCDDRGKIGHTLQICNDLDKNQDLTHVGVGVSQVLPILVMSLLAKKGDVVILEQPELHLHPKVQTRLADFFVTMTSLGKQCIVETHSEYMINRLRYLVALSDSTKIADDTMIYFVEKENSHSVYRPITINKYGVIEDWPDGFFDESEKIARDILRAGMEKKMNEDDDYEE